MKVDIDALASELEMSFDDYEMYLDLETGEVISVSHEEMRLAEDSEEDDDFSSYAAWERDAIKQAIEIFMNDERYILLPKLKESEEYDIMAEFCEGVKPAGLRDQLLGAIRGKEAFRRFKDAILRLGIEQDWYDFRSEKIRAYTIEWCKAKKIPYELSE